jgi:PAS domain S-box-containing protein
VLEFPCGRRTFEATYIPIRDGDTGHIYRIACIGRDVTLRKQHEEALQERARLEATLRKIIEASPGAIGMYRLSPEGKVSMPFISPKLEEITGYKCEEMTKDASHAYKTIHPDDLQKHIASIRASARTLSPWHNQYRLLHPAKGEVWIEGRSIPEREPDGSIVWYGFLVDITERKRAEEMLHASEQKFRALAENLPDMIVRYDRECRRIYVNRAFERNRGIPAERALNGAIEEGWSGDMSVEEFKAILRNVMDRGQPQEGGMSWTCPNGRVKHQIFHVIPERGLDGSISGVQVISRDITLLKEAELHLMESRAQLRELAAHQDAVREEERKHIALELHDDLGQFLGALRMHASMLRMQFGKDNPPLSDGLNGMIELVDRNIQAVRNISTSLRPAALDMGMEVALEWLVDDFTKYSGIPCKLELTPDKMEMTERCATALFRVTQESLTNIARHADASEVQVSLRREGGRYCLCVQDNGRGFNPERTPNKSLGLIGMRERVLMLGGEIRIDSAHGKGCRLEVQIPLGAGTGRDNQGDLVVQP